MVIWAHQPVMFGNTKFSEFLGKETHQTCAFGWCENSRFRFFFFSVDLLSFCLTVGICFEDAELVDNLEQQSLETLREMMDIGKHFHTWHFLHVSIRKTLLG